MKQGVLQGKIFVCTSALNYFTREVYNNGSGMVVNLYYFGIGITMRCAEYES